MWDTNSSRGSSLGRQCLPVPSWVGPIGCGWGVPAPFLTIPYPCGCWRVFLLLGAVAERTECGGGRIAVEILWPGWQLHHQPVPVHRGCAAALPLLPYIEPGPDGSGLRRVRESSSHHVKASSVSSRWLEGAGILYLCPSWKATTLCLSVQFIDWGWDALSSDVSSGRYLCNEVISSDFLFMLLQQFFVSIQSVWGGETWDESLRWLLSRALYPGLSLRPVYLLQSPQK